MKGLSKGCKAEGTTAWPPRPYSSWGTSLWYEWMLSEVEGRSPTAG